MNADWMMVIGVMMVTFSIPSIISAMIDRRFPYVTLAMLVVGTVLVFWASIKLPDPLSLRTIGDAFVRIIARFV